MRIVFVVASGNEVVRFVTETKNTEIDLRSVENLRVSAGSLVIRLLPDIEFQPHVLQLSRDLLFLAVQQRSRVRLSRWEEVIDLAVLLLEIAVENHNQSKLRIEAEDGTSAKSIRINRINSNRSE